MHISTIVYNQKQILFDSQHQNNIRLIKSHVVDMPQPLR